MILQAMAETGVTPAQTVMIGDTSFDMEMARAAGAFAIGVSWGYHPADRLGDAHILVDRVADLPDTLETIWRAA
jgi:phosphoglycolate phosphatase